MRDSFAIAAVLLVAWSGAGCTAPPEGAVTKDGWRSLSLIDDGKVDPAWKHVGWGGFAVDDGALRTECDEKGLGLLVYTKEALGNCQIRVVYRAKDPKSNAGVYVRIDGRILQRLDEKQPAARRNPDGTLPEDSAAAMKEGAEKEMGPWYAVHHGYEVQIADAGDEWHRTGAIYSLAKAEAAPPKEASEWRTMLITLDGKRITVDLDGQRVTQFDSDAKNLPPRKQWHEPRREHERPVAGYIGLQNHDPGDVVWFKEVSVRPLPKAP